MNKHIFILRCDWNICGDTGHDNVAVFSDENEAIDALHSYVDNEKTDTLREFFLNGVLRAGVECDDYEERNNYFLFTTKDGEWYIEVYLECFTLVK